MYEENSPEHLVRDAEKLVRLKIPMLVLSANLRCLPGIFWFSSFELVSCSMSNSNCCFLTHIQISQEAGKVVWYSHLLLCMVKVKGFSVVREAEVDVFLEFLCFSHD